ncbi:MAG: response regulator [Thermodesulfobacteriota bacterium]
MRNHYILIVEDEEKIALVLRDYLEKAGFRVSWLDRGDKVIPLVKQDVPHLILLDLMLPGKDGLELCRELRTFSQVPIIMLTARVEELERVLGLELGADDYICKPFSPREVVARIKSVLRRTAAPTLKEKLVAGPISLDEQRHQVLIAGQELNLTPSEFGILRVLLAHPHRVFSRGELSAQVQGYNFEGYDRTIDTHIKNLRKKMDAALPGQEIIKTVYGLGYKLNPLA